jgi:hypothetical protein
MLILGLLKQLGKMIIVVGPLVSDLKEILTKNPGKKEMQKAMELQTAIIEKLDDQVKIIESVLEKMQKSLVMLMYVAYIGAGVAIIALLIAIAKI